MKTDAGHGRTATLQSEVRHELQREPDWGLLPAAILGIPGLKQQQSLRDTRGAGLALPHASVS